MSSRGESPPAIFFAADAAPRPGGTAPASIRTVPPTRCRTGSAPLRQTVSVCGRPGTPRPARCLGRKSALRAGPPPWRWPARPRRWRAGPAKVCGRSGAGRAGTGPARPPPPHRSGPALSGPGPGALAAVGVGWWLAAGRPARGRPASGLVAGRLGAGGRSPPAGALCRGGGGPVAGCGRLGVGLAALPASVPPPAPNPTSPGGDPPSGPAAGWGPGPVPVPVPWSSWGLVPAAARGARGPPAPHPSQRPGEAARCRPGDGGLVSCRLRAALDTGGGNRRPKIIFPTNAAPRRHRDIGNSCASYS